MNDYTPGPWEVFEPTRTVDYMHEYWEVDAGQGFHSSEDGHGFCTTGFMNEANARLLGASPEMYEALGKLLAATCGVGCLEEAKDAAVAALSKAEYREYSMANMRPPKYVQQ